jgi:hypothetical protein
MRVINTHPNTLSNLLEILLFIALDLSNFIRIKTTGPNDMPYIKTIPIKIKLILDKPQLETLFSFELELFCVSASDIFGLYFYIYFHISNYRAIYHFNRILLQYLSENSKSNQQKFNCLPQEYRQHHCWQIESKKDFLCFPFTQKKLSYKYK